MRMIVGGATLSCDERPDNDKLNIEYTDGKDQNLA